FTDLYAMSTPDVFVITGQQLMEDAQSYASFHQSNGFTVEVVDIADVFSNFSGGVTDFAAIRNFMAHHHQKSDGALSYLTIYGDASVYAEGDRFVVPAYQSSEVWMNYMLEGGDRYFAYLDDGETFSDSDADMDIAVGRIPVATREEAAMFNQKLINYNQDRGDFQISMSLVADDEDAGVHMNIQEETFAIVDDYAKSMNIHKIYLDQYPQETQGEQQVSPLAQQALAGAFERGDIILDFMGHGGHSGWAHEQMLTVDVVNSLENEHYPFVLFPSKQNFYHPETASLAEQLLIQQNGAIACLSSTENSFSQSWNNFKSLLHQAVFEEGIVTHGLAMKYAYNHGYGTSVGSYCLLGDPLMSFPFPANEILTESINETDVESVDTLFINEPYTVEASVYDDNGIVTSFDGTARVKVFAPVHQQTTLGTDQEPFTYMLSDSLLSDQQVEVTNGVFESTFSLPANYNFSPGNIKLSYFAMNEYESAAGYEELFTVSQASGLNEQENIRFKVYPTITNSDIIIEIGSSNENGYLEILNLQGNCLHRQQIGNSGGSRINLSLSDYAPGMYIVRLLGRDSMKMKKIIRK
ncbi:MAG TPA: C25 family cysteine peptidase, partial [Bacteroidales bacterium]|nr:C25 family cysteine peptidase [Bacteroidales bacterium]